MFCECPHSAYHGPNAAVNNSWTRSGKVKPVCTANLIVLNGTATTATPIANKIYLCTPMTQSKRQIKPSSKLSYKERRNRKVKYISKNAKVLVSESDTDKSECVESEKPDCTLFSDMLFSAFSELHTPVPLEASTPIQLNRIDEMVEHSSSSEAEDQSDTPKSDSENCIC